MSLLLFIGYVNLNAMHKELGHLTPEQQNLARILTLITPETENMYKQIIPENELVNELFKKFGKQQNIIFAYTKPERIQSKIYRFSHPNQSFFQTNILGALNGSYSIILPPLDK
jgi:hypothetical protein